MLEKWLIKFSPVEVSFAFFGGVVVVGPVTSWWMSPEVYPHEGLLRDVFCATWRRF
jgi:hypothetical protein